MGFRGDAERASSGEAMSKVGALWGAVQTGGQAEWCAPDVGSLAGSVEGRASGVPHLGTSLA